MTGKMGQSGNGAQRCHKGIVKNVFNITNYVDTQANWYAEQNENLFELLASCVVKQYMVHGKRQEDSRETYKISHLLR